MRRYFVGEYKSLKYSDTADQDEGTILTEDADELVDVVKDYQVIKQKDIFRHGRNELGTYGAVGVVASEQCQLEILPKIDDPNRIESDEDCARNRLIQMLEVVHDLKFETGRQTNLNWQSETILEIFISKFCYQLREAFKKGLPMKYIEVEEDLPSLKGKLNIVRQFTALAVRPDKLACRFDNRSADIPLNQTILAALNLLSRYSRSQENRRLLIQLKFKYEGVSDVVWDILREKTVYFDRTNDQWKEVFEMARLFLDHMYQSTSIGEQKGYALLFNMNELFESYVFRLLREKFAGFGYRVESQLSNRNILYNKFGSGIFGTRLDIALLQHGQTKLIIDTKWKRLEEPSNITSKVDQADVYQMMAYGELYDCNDVVLLYPHNRGLGQTPINEQFFVKEFDGDKRIHIATIDVTKSPEECGEALRDLALSYVDGKHLMRDTLKRVA